MPYHFIAKITEGGGPTPLVELARIVEQAAASERQTAWFATRKRGADWRRPPDGTPSVVLIYTVNSQDKSIDCVVAEVLERRSGIPDDPAVLDLHQGHEGFKAWWLLANPVAVHLPSLASVPDRSTNGNRAATAFRGSLTFGYWSFGSIEQIIAHLRRTSQRL